MYKRGTQRKVKDMIYSESLDEMIIKGFYMKKNNGEYRHYTWNDLDCLYWADDVDDMFYNEVPQNAILTLNKQCSTSNRKEG